MLSWVGRGLAAAVAVSAAGCTVGAFTQHDALVKVGILGFVFFGALGLIFGFIRWLSK